MRFAFSFHYLLPGAAFIEDFPTVDHGKDFEGKAGQDFQRGVPREGTENRKRVNFLNSRDKNLAKTLKGQAKKKN